MASEKQINANRKNAKKSTGPRTIEGKVKAKRNAMKHGLAGAGVVMPIEREAVAERLYHEMIATMNVPHVAQKFLVKRLAIEAARMMGATKCRELEEQWLAQDKLHELQFRERADRVDATTKLAYKHFKKLDYYESILDEDPMLNDDEIKDLFHYIEREDSDFDVFGPTLSDLRDQGDRKNFNRIVLGEIAKTRRSHNAMLVDAEPHARLDEFSYIAGAAYIDNKKVELIVNYENRCLSRYQSIYATLEKSGAFKTHPTDTTKMKAKEPVKKESDIPNLTIDQVLPPALKKRFEDVPGALDFHRLTVNDAGYMRVKHRHK